jgi:hypothetical protein
MSDQKITLALVVKEDDLEMFMQALNEGLDRNWHRNLSKQGEPEKA